jgi:hypothetical protein
MAREEGFAIVQGPEWEATILQLADVEASLQEKIRGNVREAAAPVVADIRRAALALPAHGTKHTGLRARLAAGVQVETSGLGRIRFNATMDDPQEAELPRGEDSGIAGWRHPVYGNSNVWVHQIGGHWFRSVISDHREEFDRKIQDAIEQAANQIARAGHL